MSKWKGEWKEEKLIKKRKKMARERKVKTTNTNFKGRNEQQKRGKHGKENMRKDEREN